MQNSILDSVLNGLTSSQIPLSVWLVGAAVIIFTLGIKILAKSILPKFTSTALLNKSEIGVFNILTNIAPDGFHICPQASYGEFLKCSDRRKYWTINAKRADFVVCDSELSVLAVVEYQGGGHYGSKKSSRKSAEYRDSVKRRALAEVGIPMIEIPPKFDEETLRQALDFVFHPKQAIQNSISDNNLG